MEKISILTKLSLKDFVASISLHVISRLKKNIVKKIEVQCKSYLINLFKKLIFLFKNLEVENKHISCTKIPNTNSPRWSPLHEECDSSWISPGTSQCWRSQLQVQVSRVNYTYHILFGNTHLKHLILHVCKIKCNLSKKLSAIPWRTSIFPILYQEQL